MAYDTDFVVGCAGCAAEDCCRHSLKDLKVASTFVCSTPSLGLLQFLIGTSVGQLKCLGARVFVVGIAQVYHIDAVLARARYESQLVNTRCSYLLIATLLSQKLIFRSWLS